MIKSKRGHAVSVRDIQKLIAGHFNISLSDLLSNKKARSCSYPRQLAMYLSRKLTKLSFNEIGKAFGNKDHSTVIYAVKRIEKERDLKREVLDDINKLNGFLT
jgi:chromosomal replication initiator protein